MRNLALHLIPEMSDMSDMNEMSEFFFQLIFEIPIYTTYFIPIEITLNGFCIISSNFYELRCACAPIDLVLASKSA